MLKHHFRITISIIQQVQKSNVKIVHSGILELDEDDKGLKYKIRISET
ncbi:MAG: hypothetical protein CM15mP22_1660 [Gammaproteobacteria bacterium]|nr:MAG: hypothetical protein CM15mP22_1660 [Gammaproteobacteria bacterium]